MQSVICDLQPRCIGDCGITQSLLTLPLGTRYLINDLMDALAAVNCDEILIVPGFEPDEAYKRRITRLVPDAHVTIVSPDGRADWFLDTEPPDKLLFVDPRHRPVNGFDFTQLLEAHAGHMGAVFVTHADTAADGKVEQVLLDARGHVRKVQRVFERSLWSQSGATFVPYCIIPGELALHGPQFPLSAMRRRLAERAVPIRDLPSGSTSLDLTRKEDLLTFCCSYARDLGLEYDGNLEKLNASSDVRISVGATVSKGARLVGHVTVHADAHVADEVTIIGPAVVGRGASIGRGATIAHSVILDQAVVDAGVEIHDRVYAGGDTDDDNVQLGTMDLPARTADDGFLLVTDGGKLPTKRGFGRRATLVVKRLMDIVVAGVGIVLLSPLLLVTAALVRWTSRGSVFFAHVREGKHGREFGCLKFRTMRSDADAMQRTLQDQNQADGPQFIIKNDPRVTRLGAILRKTNIDELPQLFNVLLGHMSLVGPRPSPYRENQVCAPWRTARLSVRPGITGLWQICRYCRDEGDFHQWIYFDVAYVRKLSIRLDLKILWYTLWSFGGARSVPFEKIVGAGNSTSETSLVDPARLGTPLTVTA